ncbi:MAG: hypothetical protein EKK31_19235 [Hyphomicrobiales bacterium]|nr:MAG: hypothetical protein EKK31_19235 [Hyphomicrobiales bacterium]
MRARRRRPAPQTLPDGLHDYADDPAPRRNPSHDSSPLVFDISQLPVIDDWPEEVPVTEAEIDVFERYFGDVLDRLFGPQESKPENEGLQSLTSDANDKP